MSIRSSLTLYDKDKGLTASMVNNYVKHGYLTKPEQRKNTNANRLLVWLPSLLSSLSFRSKKSLKHLILYKLKRSSDQLYDAFVDYMNHGIDPENPIIQTSCQNWLNSIIKL